MPLNLISRQHWDSTPAPDSNFYVEIPAQFVFVMNTNTEGCDDPEGCEKQVRHVIRLAKGMHRLRDIRYNFLIGDDGRVYEGKGWYVAPLLPLKYARFNCSSILLAFIGKQTVMDITEAAAEQAGDLIQFGIENALIKKDFEFRNILMGNRIGSQDPWNRRIQDDPNNET